MMSTLNKPSFLILGAAKSGTTSLYRYLAAHPQVCMANPKEPYFFELEYEKGLSFYWSRYFSHYTGETAAGEKRHRNLFLPYVPLRIKYMFPDIKLIAILRNPVDRAFSHWWHRTFYEENLSFEKAVEQNLERIESGIDFSGDEGPGQWAEGFDDEKRTNRHRTYVDSGYYDKQIQRYMDLFPDSQIKFLLLEDLQENPTSVMEDLYRFINIDAELGPRVFSPQNMAKAPVADALINLGVKTRLNRAIPASNRVFLKKLVKRKFSKRPQMSSDMNDFLHDHYRTHIERTGKMIKRDLRHWVR